MMWLLLVWCLLSVPLGVVVGRCIAAADTTDAGGPGERWPPATPPIPPVLVLAGRP